VAHLVKYINVPKLPKQQKKAAGSFLCPAPLEYHPIKDSDHFNRADKTKRQSEIILQLPSGSLILKIKGQTSFFYPGLPKNIA